MSSYRIKEYPRGFVSEVEVEERVWLFFKKKYWTHFISVAGIESEPWYHRTFDYAMMNTLKKIERQIIDFYFDEEL